MYDEERDEMNNQFYERMHPSLAPVDGRSAPPDIETCPHEKTRSVFETPHTDICLYCGRIIKRA